MSTPASRHALLVDDDHFVRQSIEMALAAQGIDVSSAGSAVESLELLEKNTFDFAVIDVGMPGISGIELCRRIRALGHINQFPILVLSGYADKKTELEARSAGADDFLTKPFSLQTMVSLWGKYLNGTV